MFVYTLWLKPRTPFAVVVGGVSGAIAPLIADAAVNGHVSAAGWLLFSIIFIWQPPHFYAIALYHRDDYAEAQFPMLHDRIGEDATRRRIVLWILALLPVTLAPYALGMLGAGYALIAGALGSLVPRPGARAAAPPRPGERAAHVPRVARLSARHVRGDDRRSGLEDARMRAPLARLVVVACVRRRLRRGLLRRRRRRPPQPRRRGTGRHARPPAATVPEGNLRGDATAGAQVYATYCASCHGPEGKGDGPVAQTLQPPPANHADHAYMGTLSDAQLYKVISHGGAAVGKSPLMAPWGGVVNDEGIRDLIAFIRKLSST